MWNTWRVLVRAAGLLDCGTRVTHRDTLPPTWGTLLCWREVQGPLYNSAQNLVSENIGTLSQLANWGGERRFLCPCKRLYHLRKDRCVPTPFCNVIFFPKMLRFGDWLMDVQFCFFFKRQILIVNFLCAQVHEHCQTVAVYRAAFSRPGRSRRGTSNLVRSSPQNFWSDFILFT